MRQSESMTVLLKEKETKEERKFSRLKGKGTTLFFMSIKSIIHNVKKDFLGNCHVSTTEVLKQRSVTPVMRPISS